MRTGATPLAGWGAALIGVAALGVLAFGLAALPAALLGGAGAAALLTGAGVAAASRRPPAAVAVSFDSSFATLCVVTGLAVALVGAVSGQAILWPGIGLVALGAGGIAREARAARRLRRAPGKATGA